MSTKQRFTLWALAWPIFIEMFLQFLLGTADTLMVSRISDDAVAVVGISNQLFNAVTILFMTVASGAGVLIAQKLGAKRSEDARTIAIMAVKTSIWIGIGLSILLYFGASSIAVLLQLPDHLRGLATTYISIVGGGMVFTAAMASLSTAIRSTGNTRSPMYIALGMNVLHVALNYSFIYGAFGFPQWGLTGVAFSTLVSRLLATAVLIFLFIHAFERRMAWRDIRLFNRPLFREIITIGWPMGVNMSSWVLSQLVLFSFVATLGAKELAARTYMNTMESFCFILGNSVAMAVQIQIAHLYGAGKQDEAYRGSFVAMWVGLAVVAVNVALLYCFGSNVLYLFTSDPEIVALGASLLILNLLLQPLKLVNMVNNSSLTAVGDIRYMTVIGMLSLWIISVGASYFLGVHLHWGLAGIYTAMIVDEFARAAILVPRWKSRKYLQRSQPSWSERPAQHV